MGRLGEEVKNVEKLRCVLRKIGCFEPPPPSFLAAYPGAPVLAIVAGTKPASTSISLAPFEPEQRQGSDQPATGDVSNDSQQDRGVSDPAMAGIALTTSLGTTSSNAVAGIPRAYNIRAAEGQAQEAVESLRFHLAALQRAVDQAHINMSATSQEFSSLLKKVTG